MDRLMLGLSTTGVGMLVVFSGLVILIACIYIMTSITGRQRAAAKKEMTLQKAPMPAQIPAAPAAEERSEDDLQVIAAITAAIAAVWQDEGNKSGFVVRRVRRVQNSTARARAARDEQMYSHF